MGTVWGVVCVGDLRLRREGIAESRGIPTRNHAESRRGIQHDKPRNARNRRISRENPPSKCLRSSLICLIIFDRRCHQSPRWSEEMSGPLPSVFLGSVGPPRPGGWAGVSPSVVKSRALCQKTSECAGAAVVASRRQPAKTLIRAARKCGGKLRGRHRSRSRETAENCCCRQRLFFWW